MPQCWSSPSSRLGSQVIFITSHTSSAPTHPSFVYSGTPDPQAWQVGVREEGRHLKESECLPSKRLILSIQDPKAEVQVICISSVNALSFTDRPKTLFTSLNSPAVIASRQSEEPLIVSRPVEQNTSTSIAPEYPGLCEKVWRAWIWPMRHSPIVRIPCPQSSVGPMSDTQRMGSPYGIFKRRTELSK